MPETRKEILLNCRSGIEPQIFASLCPGESSGCRLVQAKVLKVCQSGEFIKTLFVQFALDIKLEQLNEIIRDAAQDSSDYQLNPHLSLLYKKMSILARRELADSIKVPFSEVTFESMKAIRCVSPTWSRADVEAWRVVAAKSLGG
jgi:hypothetical protein